MKFNKITNEQCKDSGLALILLALLAVWFGFEKDIFLAAAILVLIINMAIPILLKPFAFFWFGLSQIMGEVVSRVLLSVLFFLVVTPIGILIRLCGKDSMRLKGWKNDSESLFVDCSRTYSASDLENPF